MSTWQRVISYKFQYCYLMFLKTQTYLFTLGIAYRALSKTVLHPRNCQNMPLDSAPALPRSHRPVAKKIECGLGDLICKLGL